MSIDLTATHKAWGARATVAGLGQFVLAGMPSKRSGTDSSRSTCSIPTIGLPEFAGGELVVVEISCNGIWVPFFVGYIDPISASIRPALAQVDLVDCMSKLASAPAEPIVWASTSFADAVRMILTAGGIVNVGQIDDPGSAYTLGTQSAITIAISENLNSVLAELLEFGGCSLYVSATGAVHVVYTSGIPSESSATVYAYAANYGIGELGHTAASTTIESITTVLQSFTASGPKRLDGVTPTYTFIADGVIGIADAKSYRFAQESATVQAIAEREVERRARRKRTLSITVPLNTGLEPTASILFRNPYVACPTNMPAFVKALNSSGTSLVLQLELGASELTGYTPQQPPVADFSMLVEQEPILVSGSPVQRYFVQCTDASRDPDGSIQAWSWVVTGVTATPSTSTAQHPIFVMEEIEGAEITLTVTDNDVLTGSLTKPVQDANTTVVRRVLSIAEGAGGWAVCQDGETWEVYTRSGHSCTAVPSFNDGGPLMSGWSDGTIYTLEPDGEGVSQLVLKGTVSTSVSCLFVNEADNANVLIGAGTKLYRSTAGGASPTLLKDFGAGSDVRDCQSSPANVNEIRVAVGRYVVISFDGRTFNSVIEADTGLAVRSIASAPWGHAAAVDGGAVPADAVQFEEGYSVDWAGVPSPPNALRSITPLLSQPGFLAADVTGRFYKLLKEADGNNFVASVVGQIVSEPDVPDVTRDGTMAGLAFAASADGSKKLVNLATIFDLREEPSLQIGYGKIGVATPPASPAALYWATYGGSTGTSGVYAYVNGAWERRGASTLPLGAYWFNISASKYDANRLLLFGNGTESITFTASGGNIKMAGTGFTAYSPFWCSGDGGVTWSQIPVSTTSSSTTTIIAEGFCWSEGINSQNRFGITGSVFTGIDRVASFWHGTANGGSATVAAPIVASINTWGENHYICPGDANEYVVNAVDGGTNYRYKISWVGASAYNLTPGVRPVLASGLIRRVPGGRAMVGIINNSLHATGDYKASQMADRTTGNIADLAILSDRSIYAVGTSGVVRMTGYLLGSPTTTVVIPSGDFTAYRIKADSQTRTKLAVRAARSDGSEGIDTFNGTSWATVLRPTPNMSPVAFEVVGGTL